MTLPRSGHRDSVRPGVAVGVELPFGLEGSEAIGEGLPDGRAEATLAGAASRPRVRAIATTQRRAASVIYNVVEAVVAISAGLVAGSVALVGFGLDSIVEVSSGLIILWQFRHRIPESRERLALRLLAVSFFALAGYVSFESVRAFVGAERPDASPVGIVLAIASLIVMPLLSRAQRRTGRALGSNAVFADGTQTLLCAYLSAVLLVGLLLNATLGWYWADPVAGLVIAAVALREGLEAWRGEGCCAPNTTALAEDDSQGCGCGDAGCACAGQVVYRPTAAPSP
jgi:Co/Zn/Cd efflux system component